MTLPNDPPHLFRHQQELLDKTWKLPAWAILFETGCGKTAPTIHTAARLFLERNIVGAIVVAPNGVHRNWITDELPVHSPVAWNGLDWHSGRGKAQDRAVAKLLETQSGVLPWLALTYDGLLTPRGRQVVLDFKARFPQFIFVIDEGSRVKNPMARRTKKVAALRGLAAYVRLLNGTPVETPLDLYAQMKILDERFWLRHGIGSWTAFQSRFAVMRKIVIGGEDDREAGADRKWEPIIPHGADRAMVDAYEQLDLEGVLDDEDKKTISRAAAQPAKATIGRTIEVPFGYRDLDKLNQMIQPLSTRLTKEQAGLNLPPKLYQRLIFELVPEQRRVYDQLRREFMVEFDSGLLVTAPLALVRILRLQQVACGYLPNPDDPEGPVILIPGANNPRLEQFLDWIEDIGKAQVIVWARFTRDVDEICRVLGPPKCVRYDGKVGERDRAEALDLFRSGRRQFIVAKVTSMGMGLTLVNSAIAYFYSNTFTMLDRLQAEDRQHRPGQHHAVTYIDAIAENTVDEKILKTLREKKDIADRVVGDELREWLS